MNLELWRTRQSDSNLQVMDSNLFSNWSWRLKGRQSDSNFRVTNSNHSLVQNSNITKAIRITYIVIWIPYAAEALNARPASATTRFLIQISLTMASWSSLMIINDRLGIYASKNPWRKNNNILRAKIHQDHSLSLLEPSSVKFLNLWVK